MKVSQNLADRLEEIPTTFCTTGAAKRGGPGLAGYDLITSWSRKSVTRSDAICQSQSQLSKVVARWLRPA
jgi:hypothetical protein